MELLFGDLTSRVISASYKVFNTLGYGFLEKVYENVMCIELRKSGINFTSQSAVEVYYDGLKAGHYIADLIVDEKLIVEIKAAECLREEHECQLINYLRATDIEVSTCLISVQSIQSVF